MKKIIMSVLIIFGIMSAGIVILASDGIDLGVQKLIRELTGEVLFENNNSADENVAKPIIFDEDYKIEIVVEDLEKPSSMIFIGNEMFVTELETGKILKISDNGIVQTILELSVSPYTNECAGCGLLGMTNLGEDVYIYYTTIPTSDQERQNIVTKYRYDGKSFVEPVIIKKIHGTEIDHNGGAMTTGINNDIYFVVGDQTEVSEYINFPTSEKWNYSTELQSIVRGSLYLDNGIEDTAGIFKIHDGEIERFAMGIRNSFGLAVDPETGFLWETENGPQMYDEINLVEEKFNGGWIVFNGPSTAPDSKVMDQFLPEIIINYKDYKYSEPEFSWHVPVSPTAIEFPNSPDFEKYSDYAFVGAFNTGTIYKFQLNTDRTQFIFEDESLKDLVYNDLDNNEEIIFVTGINGGVSDIVFNDDEMYIISIYDGVIYKISLKK